MQLEAGQTLSSYEILGSLGAGAMGEVYRARDTKLGREVAIKVLPDCLVEEPEHRHRFEREARTLASLNHPNVGGIHGIAMAGELTFLALELIPGEDLCERLARGALPIDVAVDVCLQIAAGLEAAHLAGVVHRDLKPANVRVTPEGTVKVVDFGLARAMGSQAADPARTEQGRILGTPAYMSPEQARGQAVDTRSDVWAFGCLLFECLTGRRVFGGSTVADVLAAVTDRQPEWDALPGGTPHHIRRLLERCLTKDVRRRLQSIGEARIVLEDPAAPNAIVESPPSRSRLRRIVLAITAAALCVGYFFGTRTAVSSSAAGEVRLGVHLPPGQRLDLPNPHGGGGDGLASPVAISFDGRTLAYLAREADGSTGLYVRPIEDFASVRLEHTKNAEAPFFAPDGRSVGFFREGGVYRIAVHGGSEPKLVCPIPLIDRPSGAWSADGTIVFSRGINAEGRLEVVAADGGEPRPLTVPDFARGESWHGLPRILPDGYTVLFTVDSRQGTRAALVDLRRGEWRFIEGTGEAVGARFLPANDEHPALLVFAQSGKILAGELDLAAGRLIGEPRVVVEQVSYSAALGVGHWDCAPNGALAYVSGNVVQSELVLANRSGEITWRSKEVGAYQHPRLSADNRQLLFDRIKSGGRDIWVYDLEREVPRQLTSAIQNMDPLWAPDGRHIIFSRFVRYVRVLHMLDTTKVGAEPVQLLEGRNRNQISGTWTPAGGLLFTEVGAEKEDIRILPELGRPDARSVLSGPGRQGFADVSPHGDLLAYVSDRTGNLEVYVCSYPDLADERRISFGLGSEPLWSKDGEELFLRMGPALDFYAAPVVVRDGDKEIGTPERLFGGPYDRSPSGHQHYDVSRDGQTFALVRKLENESPTELRVILNWKPWIGSGDR